MPDDRQGSDISVDQRSETLSTQQPGLATTEQVTRDVAAEHRQRADQIDQILLVILGIIEIGMGLRFLLKLIAANPGNGFADLVYSATHPVVAPFVGLVSTPASGGVVFEVTTLIGMAVYALLFWILIKIVGIFAVHPSAKVVSRSTSQAAGGTQSPPRTSGG